MPTVIKPKPDQPSTQTVQDSIVLQLGNDYYSSQTFDGGESYFTTAELIVNAYGETLRPVWDQDWTEIAPGVRSKINALEIQNDACPITISFQRKREGRTWNRRNDEYDYHSAVDHYTIRYEEGS